MNFRLIILLLFIVNNLTAQINSFDDFTIENLIENENIRYHTDLYLIQKSEFSQYPIPLNLGNKDFASVKVFSYDKISDVKYKLYAIAACENYYLQDSIKIDRIKIGIIEINFEYSKDLNYLTTHEVNWINQFSDTNSFYEASINYNKLGSINLFKIDEKTLKILVNNIQQIIQIKAKDYFLIKGLFENFGLIKEIKKDGKEFNIDIDFVQLIYRKEALEAAKADGNIDKCKNDIYIRNISNKLRTYKLDNEPTIYLNNPHRRRININEFCNDKSLYLDGVFLVEIENSVIKSLIEIGGITNKP